MVRSRVEAVVEELLATGKIADPNHVKLERSRRAVVEQWRTVAAVLDGQGEIALAGDVRYFAAHLPPVLTDRERLGTRFIDHLRSVSANKEVRSPDIEPLCR